jgi:S1-C subfamily serine protease
LRSQYQIPLGEDDTAVAVLPAARGPAFAWHGEQDELQLQGLFPPQPQLLDVGLIVQAAKRALAICRVEVGTGLKGTGVLIGANLVLTNYHVMAGDLAAPRTTLAENAPSTVLRFGAFTNTGVSPQDGQTVKLAAENPIVDADPQLDFALLRTSNQIAAAKDIVPYAELGPLPARADALYVLQHPEGGPMKLALSSNGVTWVDVQYGIIQYVTRVNFGSSGSPCFDDKWKLIALHHAGNQKKGEGILMQSIFAKIQPYLPK